MACKPRRPYWSAESSELLHAGRSGALSAMGFVGSVAYTLLLRAWHVLTSHVSATVSRIHLHIAYTGSQTPRMQIAKALKKVSDPYLRPLCRAPGPSKNGCRLVTRSKIIGWGCRQFCLDRTGPKMPNPLRNLEGASYLSR